jgi:uracil-DNA glycosylase
MYRASRSFRWGIAIPVEAAAVTCPPRRECAELWLAQLLAKLPQIEMTLLIGQHAQRHFLGNRRKSSLAETTKAWREFASQYIPLPHPSPRNTPWFQRNSGFEQQLLPELRMRIGVLLAR